MYNRTYSAGDAMASPLTHTCLSLMFILHMTFGVTLSPVKGDHARANCQRQGVIRCDRRQARQYIWRCAPTLLKTKITYHIPLNTLYCIYPSLVKQIY